MVSEIFTSGTTGDVSRTWVSSRDWLAERGARLLIDFGAAAWSGGKVERLWCRWRWRQTGGRKEESSAAEESNLSSSSESRLYWLQALAKDSV